MRALALSLKVDSSSKVMPSAPPAPVCSTTPLKMSSLTLSAFVLLLRVSLAGACTVATLPIESSDAGVAAVWFDADCDAAGCCVAGCCAVGCVVVGGLAAGHESCGGGNGDCAD